MSQVKEFSPLETMVQQQIVQRGIRDERVVAALREVARDKFFPRGSKDEAFADRAVSIGHGQTISQPYMVALMTHRLDVRPEHRVLEIGTGSGYQTAVLASLAGEVYTVERVKPLLDEAWERLMQMRVRNVHFRHGDGTLGWSEEGPFDRLLVTAGAPALPERLLLSQLREDGTAVVPVGTQDAQMLVEVRRRRNKLTVSNICPCRFVKLIGEQGWAVEK